MSVADDIRDFVASEVVVDRSLAPNEDLIESDLLDSAGLVALVGFLEERFGIVLDDDHDLTADNFRTIEAMTALVERRQGDAGRGTP